MRACRGRVTTLMWKWTSRGSHRAPAWYETIVPRVKQPYSCALTLITPSVAVKFAFSSCTLHAANFLSDPSLLHSMFDPWLLKSHGVQPYSETGTPLNRFLAELVECNYSFIFSLFFWHYFYFIVGPMSTSYLFFLTPQKVVVWPPKSFTCRDFLFTHTHTHTHRDKHLLPHVRALDLICWM